MDYSGLRRTDLLRPNVSTGGTHGFGETLAAGDFNGDGYDDLAVGNPNDDSLRWSRTPKAFPTIRIATAGSVWIVPGGPAGLRVDLASHLTQDTPGSPSVASSGEYFGWTLAAGDINGDGRADLAVHTLDEEVGGAALAGAVTVFYGGAAGITTSGALWLDQSMAAVPGTARALNNFGTGLAIGDITGDVYADLVVGAPNDNDGISWRPDHAGTGRFAVFRGTPDGLSLTGVGDVTAWGVGLPPGGWPDPIVQYLGTGLAIGDLTGDGFGEVVATAPASQVGNVLSGAVVVLRGTAGGVTLSGRQVISENTPGVPGTPVHEQWFGGGGVHVGDLTGDGRPDALISSHSKHIGSAADAGSILLLPGTAAGIGTAGARLFDQNTVPGLGGPQTNEAFGRFVALANLDGTGALDALVTTGSEQSWGQPQGVVTVFGGGNGTLTPYGTVASASYQPDLVVFNFGRLA